MDCLIKFPTFGIRACMTSALFKNFSFRFRKIFVWKLLLMKCLNVYEVWCLNSTVLNLVLGAFKIRILNTFIQYGFYIFFNGNKMVRNL